MSQTPPLVWNFSNAFTKVAISLKANRRKKVMQIYEKSEENKETQD